MNQDPNESIDRLLDLGLRNLWYPIAASWQVADKPVPVTRLGDRLVLWRDHEGVVHVMEDRCPHRGARLSLGRNLGDRIACWYHGVQVDGRGVVVDVPAVDACPLEGRQAVRVYPSIEVKGGIFAYFGDALHPETVELRLPEQMTDPRFDGFLCTARWNVNYRYAIDNVMDPMHGSYLHAVSHSMAQGDKEAKFRIRTTEGGFVFEKVGQHGVNFDWVEFGDTGTHWMRLNLPYRKNAGPGGLFWINGWVTPIDARSCQVYFWRIREVEGWQRDLWRFLYKTKLEGLHWAVLEQDRIILEDMPRDARSRENLYQHDTGLARVRRLMEDRAREQIASLAAAGIDAPRVAAE
ncbi:MAG: aromatic ring-hydroxylating dioxygenase subunit alpha [Alphaproteobacteria bacterium]|nr:aromatic ring-hydroxylating dioxygenase subunit alpha [Alphaproteobacteria bacterium]